MFLRPRSVVLLVGARALLRADDGGWRSEGRCVWRSEGRRVWRSEGRRVEEDWPRIRIASSVAPARTPRAPPQETMGRPGHELRKLHPSGRQRSLNHYWYRRWPRLIRLLESPQTSHARRCATPSTRSTRRRRRRRSGWKGPDAVKVSVGRYLAATCAPAKVMVVEDVTRTVKDTLINNSLRGEERVLVPPVEETELATDLLQHFNIKFHPLRDHARLVSEALKSHEKKPLRVVLQLPRAATDQKVIDVLWDAADFKDYASDDVAIVVVTPVPVPETVDPLVAPPGDLDRALRSKAWTDLAHSQRTSPLPSSTLLHASACRCTSRAPCLHASAYVTALSRLCTCLCMLHLKRTCRPRRQQSQLR